jgi:cobaltochelatase CobT
VFGPHLQPSLEHDDFASFRGAADAIALRLRLSDPALHRRLCPSAPLQRWVFELLEQCRVEALVPASLPGVARNLRHRFEQWSLAFHHAGGTEDAQGLLLYTLAQVCRSRVTGEPVVEATEDLLEATRAGIVPAIGHALAGLKRERADQSAYAVHALAIVRWAAGQVAAAQRQGATPREGDDAARERDLRFGLLMDFDAEADDGIADATPGASRVLTDAGGRYRVYTTAYDREVRAATLVRRELLCEYRERLDRRIVAQGVNLARLARELKQLLAEPSQDGWEDAQEEGRIDGRRLARLVATPAERRLFRSERFEPTADAVAAFLIDCSGSMRQHIESVAMIVDVLSRALEQAGVATEVLGFTTGAWNGGRAQRDWQHAGRPAAPGRLNEVLHLVFKDADTPWRRARRDLAALLKADLFREGVDGEAVQWACARLAARAERQRLLFVVSDGCPMDTATSLANDPHYLDQHLRDVVARCEREARVRILGIGVGLDLSPYYGRSQALDLSAPPGHRIFRDVLGLIAGGGRR